MPTLFRSSIFAQWKKIMQIIKDYGDDFWDIISIWNFVPTVKGGNKIVPKPRSQFGYEQTEKVAKYYRALNILFCGLDPCKFNQVSSCDTARYVWDTLEITYEESS